MNIFIHASKLDEIVHKLYETDIPMLHYISFTLIFWERYNHPLSRVAQGGVLGPVGKIMAQINKISLSDTH